MSDDPYEALTLTPWRTGRRVGRTLYAQIGPAPSDLDVLIGVMDSTVLAQQAVRDHNAARQQRLDRPRP
jgi:hypothetical protein